MSKMSKLCQVVYHSTRLDGTNVFKLLCGYSGSKDNYHKQSECSTWKRYLWYRYSAKMMTSFFELRFSKFFAWYKKKTNTIIGILRKFWTRNICFLFKNIDLKSWPDLDLNLTCPPSKVSLDDVVGSKVTSEICLQNEPESMCCTTCLWLLFYSDPLWPDLDLFKDALHTHAVFFVDIYPALWVSVSSLHLV